MMNLNGAKPLNRIPPLAQTRAYQTYQVSSPLETHYRKATCAEINCPHYLYGWRLQLNTLHPIDKQTIKDSRRKYTVEEDASGVKWLCFEAGQPCFKASTHRAPVGRPEIYRVGRGDWRSYNPREAQQLKTEDWLDHFKNHQDRLSTIQQRG